MGAPIRELLIIIIIINKQRFCMVGVECGLIINDSVGVGTVE
jgi:hypothetical protein